MYKRVGDGSIYYLASPGEDDIISFGHLEGSDPRRVGGGFFSLNHVEPFLTDVEAIAVALRCDAFVLEIEESQARGSTFRSDNHLLGRTSAKG